MAQKFAPWFETARVDNIMELEDNARNSVLSALVMSNQVDLTIIIKAEDISSGESEILVVESELGVDELVRADTRQAAIDMTEWKNAIRTIHMFHVEDRVGVGFVPRLTGYVDLVHSFDTFHLVIVLWENLTEGTINLF